MTELKMTAVVFNFYLKIEETLTINAANQGIIFYLKAKKNKKSKYKEELKT